jgi:TetR/AcrR family transcriptional repressor of nem operon
LRSARTHGGFYRHFASKDVLITESTRAAFREILQRYQAHAAKDGPKAALAAYVDDYLDNRHVRAPEDGCPIAAYGPEAARESETVGEVFAEGTEQLMAMIGRGLSCQKEQRQARAVELQALLAGAVVMVRAAGDAKLAQHVLSIARKRARRMIRER